MLAAGLQRSMHCQSGGRAARLRGDADVWVLAVNVGLDWD